MMNIKAIVHSYIQHIRPRAQAELDWFRQQPDLDSAIENAALAINSNGKKYSHQWKIKKDALGQARQVLMAHSEAIEQCQNFDELLALIDTILRPISGIGELYIYDTSLRIGANLNLLPTRVYLHRGTRDGAIALGFDGKNEALEVSVLPKELQKLEPHEIEDVLCIFKTELKGENLKFMGKNLSKRSWCS